MAIDAGLTSVPNLADRVGRLLPAGLLERPNRLARSTLVLERQVVGRCSARHGAEALDNAGAVAIQGTSHGRQDDDAAARAKNGQDTLVEVGDMVVVEGKRLLNDVGVKAIECNARVVYPDIRNMTGQLSKPRRRLCPARLTACPSRLPCLAETQRWRLCLPSH